MRRMIDNFQPIQIGTALILLILSFVLNTDGVIFPIYMVAVIGSLLFFSPFESYMIVGPILTIISTMMVFGLQIVKEGDGFLILTFMLIIFILIIGGTIFFIRRLVMIRKLRKYSGIVNSLSDDKLHFNEEKLRESKLSTEELSFFKSEMRKYYKSYQYLQSVKDLMEHQVDSYDKDLTMIHAIFNELIDSPRMLLKMNDFLYSHLKDYVDKVKAIVDLDDNVVESDEDKQLVENAKNQLATISHQFRDDFIQVTEDERDALKE